MAIEMFIFQIMTSIFYQKLINLWFFENVDVYKLKEHINTNAHNTYLLIVFYFFLNLVYWIFKYNT